METIVRHRYNHFNNGWGAWMYDGSGKTLEQMSEHACNLLRKDEGKSYTACEIQTLQVVGPTTKLEVTKKVHVDQTQVRTDS